MKHRSDIDGLRAVSIIPVLLFHAEIPGVGGGFVGVDVFFVISGYLITALIAEEMRQDRFSLTGFYERRIRRILPALLVMLLASGVVGSVLLLPVDFREFSDSLTAAVLSVSNIFFWRQSGYFDDQALMKPLLHTWSLAVEEQFYLFFPLYLMAVLRWGRGRWVAAVLPVALLSLALSVYGVAHKPDAAFYLLPTRAWELLVGSLLALGAVPAFRGRMANELGGLLGLGLIGWSVFTFSDHTPFPGLNALYPCLGAALVIHTGAAGTLVGRLLATGPLVFVGLISYSLYLWHWPVLVFANYHAMAPLGAAETAAALAACAGLAVLSWRFVETPLRRGGSPIAGGRRAFGFATVAAVLFVGAGAAGHVSDGWESRFTPQVVAVDAMSGNRNDTLLPCHSRRPDDVAAGRLCTIGAEGAETSWLLWGDSHAWAMQQLYDEAFRSLGVRAVVASYDGCAPLFGITRVGYPGPCRAFSDAVARKIDGGGIRNVAMVAFWEGYYRDTLQADAQTTRHDREQTAAALNRGLVSTVTTLSDRGIRVHLADSLPGVRVNAPRALAAALAWNRPIDPRFTAEEYHAMNRDYFAAVETVQDRLASRLTLWRTLCAGGRCEAEANGLPIYFDSNHPTRTNFAFAADPIRRFLREGSGSVAMAR